MFDRPTSLLSAFLPEVHFEKRYWHGFAAATMVAGFAAIAALPPGAPSELAASSPAGGQSHPAQSQPARTQAAQTPAVQSVAGQNLPGQHLSAPHRPPQNQTARQQPVQRTADQLDRARPRPSRHFARPRHPQNYLIYDSITPSAIPQNHMIATYANGTYAVPSSQVASRGPVLWIDVNGQDTSASVLDVEPGDATPSQAADWAQRKLSATPNGVAIIYTMRSEWQAAQAAVAALPSGISSRVHWWIADPTGVPHVVPGSDATQWYWGTNYDISTATAQFRG